ncbi:MAG: hypothetical protein ACI9TH_004178 [Kiritimatiellia bacterium]|jgi:hypothetical protein
MFTPVKMRVFINYLERGPETWKFLTLKLCNRNNENPTVSEEEEIRKPSRRYASKTSTRRHDVDGTKSFLLWGVGLLAFGLWHVMDGWFPQESDIDEHGPPPSSATAFIVKDTKGTTHFYQYNRITGVLLVVSSCVCLYVHKVVK